MQKAISFLKQNLDSVMVVVIVILGFVLYANTFGNKMFWDDNDFIINNAFVHSWQYLPQYFSQNVISGAQLISNYWRPLLLIVFSVEWHLWGVHVFGYHLVNLLFHIADALLLYYLFKTLFNKTWLAFFAGIIFLIHPLQTEAVTYVNSLGDSLSVFFMLLGLNNYLYARQNNDKKSFWWSVAFFPLALMSKETAIVYPGLVVLIELFANQKEIASASVKSLVRLAKTTWPSIAIAGIYILLRATVLNFQNTFNLYNQQNAFTAHLGVRILTFFRILWTYLGLLFYPHNLHMERSIDIAGKFSSDVIFGLLFFITLFALSIWTYKKHPIISFGALWFLIGLAPTSNIAVPINGLLYEHWLYLPLAGFFLMVFGLISTVIPAEAGIQARSLITGSPIPPASVKHVRAGRSGMTIILLIYFLFLSITTIARNREWRDPITFYNQTLQYAPDSYRVINNLGMAYADTNDLAQAEKMYQRAISLDSSNAVAYHNLGNAYKQSGQTELAIQNYNTAIKKDPKFIFSYYALAQLYIDQKNYDQALDYLQQLQNISPSSTTQSYIDQINQLKAR